MKREKLKAKRYLRRKRSVRHKIFGTPERPRLSVSRSNRQISAQLIDDLNGVTLCSAGTREKSFDGKSGNSVNCEIAGQVGQALAEKARMKDIRTVTFDRNGFRYHGRIKALADAARKAGLEF